MDRIDTPTATTGRLFSEGNLSLGQPPTKLNSKWFNNVQESLMGLLFVAGITPDGEQSGFGQVATAVQSLISTAVSAATATLNAAIAAATESARPYAAGRILVTTGGPVLQSGSRNVASVSYQSSNTELRIHFTNSIPANRTLVVSPGTNGFWVIGKYANTTDAGIYGVSDSGGTGYNDAAWSQEISFVVV